MFRRARVFTLFENSTFKCLSYCCLCILSYDIRKYFNTEKNSNINFKIENQLKARRITTKHSKM